MRKKRFLLWALLLLLCGAALTVYLCNKAVVNAAEGKLYSDTQSIPYNRVGLLLGTSKSINGRDNPFYVHRINAAAALLKANKIKYLVISGDNSRKDYDEPTSMRADLIKAGIDSTVIYLDYAGFRTFDSMVR